MATYGDNCIATREVLWSLRIDVRVDPGHTGVTPNFTGARSDGQCTGTINIIPRDTHGNNLGPDRADRISVTGVPGTTVTGPVKDNGDGSYAVPVAWDPGPGRDPGVVVGQPDRPPSVVVPKPKKDRCRKWKFLVWLLLLLVLVLLLLLLLK